MEEKKQSEILKYAFMVWQRIAADGTLWTSKEWHTVVQTVRALWDILDEEIVCMSSDQQPHSSASSDAKSV